MAWSISLSWMLLLSRQKVADSAVDDTSSSSEEEELKRSTSYSDISDVYLDLVPPVVRSQSVALTPEAANVEHDDKTAEVCLAS